MRVIHRWPVNSPHTWPVTRKMFSFDDVIICAEILIYLHARSFGACVRIGVECISAPTTNSSISTCYQRSQFNGCNLICALHNRWSSSPSLSLYSLDQIVSLCIHNINFHRIAWLCHNIAFSLAYSYQVDFLSVFYIPSEYNMAGCTEYLEARVKLNYRLNARWQYGSSHLDWY